MSIAVQEILPTDWRDVFAPDWARIGLGLDIATTTNEKSNPSSLTVTQQVALSYYARLVLRWKTADPEVTTAILRAVLTGLPHGLRARRLCIDATSERFFAARLKSELARLVPVELVVSSETTTHLGEEMTYKAYLGNLLINTIEDGYFAIPPEAWLKADYRLVNRDRGSFVTDLGEDGGHGDCFDSAKLSLHALKGKGGPAKASAAPTGSMHAGGYTAQRKVLNPHAHRFGRKSGGRRPI